VNIGIVKETRPDERRVAASPAVAGRLVKSGFTVLVERGAGASASFPDELYQAAGAQLVGTDEAWQADVVAKVRPSVRKFHSSEYLSALATGEICLVVGWSGDIMQARARAAEAKNGIEIGYAIPKEGAQMFFDNFAIPADAKNVAEAYELINYLYRPDVAAKNSDFLSYANGNFASQKLVDPKILGDKNIYPDEATLSKLFVITARDPATQRIINRLWTRVKTGR
jgi:putrescine transport system substrate-binding protein